MATSFRVYFGSTSATEEELGRIERIVVAQEMEMAWQAEIRMSLCLDDAGHWRHLPAELAQPFSRVRVEIRKGNGPFTALIDGPVTGLKTALASAPGTSVAEIVVRDDSVLLNREESTEIFEERRDSDLADEMFRRVATVTGRDILSTASTVPVTVKRGTPIQFIRELAAVHGYLAYVLPGPEAGQSVGCFRPPPDEEPTLPPLVLLGPGHSLEDAEFNDDSEGPETTRGRSLRISDQQVVSAERSVQDERLLRALPTVPESSTALRDLPPEKSTREDPEAEVTAQARRASYSLTLDARVEPGCYDAVLTPYRTVSVQAGDTPYSGTWLLHRVTHTITPSAYTEEIQARRQGLSDVAGGELASLVSEVF